MTVGSGIDLKEQRPSYVVFERRPVEDRQASLDRGCYTTKDVDYAIVTPVGSKDRIPREVNDWLKNLEQQAREGRIPINWPKQYREAYEYWKRGEEIPLQGTSIKGWPMLSPAQRENIISANIRTVEDLAECNEEAMRRIGMGALDLRQKAQSWIQSVKDAGAVAAENASLKFKVEQQTGAITRLEAQVQQLGHELKVLAKHGSVSEAVREARAEIAAEEILP